jgi:GTP:adenosylcobinamide-phosphate guanylyltransferase
MDAMVTAGGIPKPDDPLYQYTQGKSKALVDVAGKPMAQWVLNALGNARNIDRVVVVGVDESSGLTCKKPLTFISNRGGMVSNIRAGVEKIQELNPSSQYTVIASSDVPAITGVMVDWAVDAAMETQDGLYYNVIERSVMEKRFPNSNRTYTKVKGMQVAGGDLNIVANWSVTAQEGLWNRLEAARKNPLRQAALVGFDTLFLMLFRLVDIHQAAAQVSKRLRIPCRAILCPYAEIGMDVDKPAQLELLRKDLAGRPA